MSDSTAAEVDSGSLTSSHSPKTSMSVCCLAVYAGLIQNFMLSDTWTWVHYISQWSTTLQQWGQCLISSVMNWCSVLWSDQRFNSKHHFTVRASAPTVSGSVQIWLLFLWPDGVKLSCSTPRILYQSKMDCALQTKLAPKPLTSSLFDLI